MAYNEFSLDGVKQQFGLTTNERGDLFGGVAGVAISGWLRETLDQNLPLALAMATEKARSELLIMPILLEVRRQRGRGFSLFSGVEFDVDCDRGLFGVCDFLLSLNGLQLTVQSPVVAVMAAESGDIHAGIGECVAEMVAAQMFNGQRGNAIGAVYGVVTTGSVWKFLRLTGTVAAVDLSEYYIKEVERVVGILVAMVSPGGVV